ncbi:MAG: GspH/FimT family pseudopilin [Planctomycetota bacterium]
MSFQNTMSFRRDNGFTLMEMMLVVFLLGLAFGYVIIRLDNILPRERLQAGARGLAAAAAEAREAAVYRNEPVFMHYDLTEPHRRYWISIRGADGREDPTAPQILPEGVSITDVTLGDRVMTSGDVTVRFDPTGDVEGHAVHLGDKDGKEMSILVHPLLGTVRTEEGRVDPESFEEEAPSE